MVNYIKQRGIVLVTTLLTIVLVVMMITVVVHSGAAGLALTANFHDRESALMAAESGLQYAVTRMQDNMSWRGDDPSNAPSATSSFQVVEDNGNVLGIITSKLGKKSVFRIKFNCQDGSPSYDAAGKLVAGSDGDCLADPAKIKIRMPYLSVNNLLGTSAVPQYRAQADGSGLATGTTNEIPRATAAILVQGLAGPGVREATVNDTGEYSNVAVRILESYLASDGLAGMDSAAYAAGSINAKVADKGKFDVNSNEQSTDPRIRSLADVDIAALRSNKGDSSVGEAYFNIGDGQVVVKDGHAFRLNGQDHKSVANEDSTSRFKKLTWDEINKAKPTDNPLDAGTYVWKQVNGKPTLVYYAGNYPVGTALPTEGGMEVSFASNPAITMDSDNMALLISDNVFVTANNGFGGIVIRTDDSITTGRPLVGFASPAEGQQAAVLTASGDVQFEGGVMGTGAVTTEGSVSFQGPSILESDPETGVSIYAQGDITLEAIEKPAAGSKQPKQAVKSTKEQANNGHFIMAFPREQQQPNDDFQEQPQGDDDERCYKCYDLGRPGCDIHGYSRPQGCEGCYTYGYSNCPTHGTDAEGEDESSPDDPDSVNEATEISITDPEDFTVPEYINPSDREAFTIKKKQQLAKMIAKHSKVTYADQDISGVIYTWGNFNVNVGSNSLLNVTGTIIAYGADPNSSNTTAGSDSTRGNINIRAKNVELTYDPSYIKELLGGTSSIRLKRTLWATW